jgi:hypothetical protein
MWSVPRCYKQGTKLVDISVLYGRPWKKELVARVLCGKSGCKEKNLWWYLECVIKWDCYRSCVKMRCHETASVWCNRLRILACVCQCSAKCSHELWVYRWSVNRVNPNPVYNESNTWQLVSELVGLENTVRGYTSILWRWNKWWHAYRLN